MRRLDGGGVMGSELVVIVGILVVLLGPVVLWLAVILGRRYAKERRLTKASSLLGEPAASMVDGVKLLSVERGDIHSLKLSSLGASLLVELELSSSELPALLWVERVEEQWRLGCGVASCTDHALPWLDRLGVEHHASSFLGHAFQVHGSRDASTLWSSRLEVALSQSLTHELIAQLVDRFIAQEKTLLEGISAWSVGALALERLSEVALDEAQGLSLRQLCAALAIDGLSQSGADEFIARLMAGERWDVLVRCVDTSWPSRLNEAQLGALLSELYEHDAALQIETGRSLALAVAPEQWQMISSSAMTLRLAIVIGWRHHQARADEEIEAALVMLAKGLSDQTLSDALEFVLGWRAWGWTAFIERLNAASLSQANIAQLLAILAQPRAQVHKLRYTEEMCRLLILAMGRADRAQRDELAALLLRHGGASAREALKAVLKGDAWISPEMVQAYQELLMSLSVGQEPRERAGALSVHEASASEGALSQVNAEAGSLEVID